MCGVAAMLMLAVGLGALILRPDPRTVGLDPTLVKWASQLRTPDSLYRRVVGRSVAKVAPGLSARFPRALGPDDTAAQHRRLNACHALQALGPAARPALPLLVEAFGDRRTDVRTYTLLTIAAVKASPEEVAQLLRAAGRPLDLEVATLCGVLETEDEQLRAFAWRCLEELGTAAGAAAGRLIALLEPGREAGTRLAAITVLGRLGPPAYPAGPSLVGILSNGHELSELRAAAAASLGLLGAQAADSRPVLQKSLGDDAAVVRVQAAGALWRLGATPPEILPIVIEGLTNRSIHARMAADEILDAITAAEPEDALPSPATPAVPGS